MGLCRQRAGEKSHITGQKLILVPNDFADLSDFSVKKLATSNAFTAVPFRVTA
jgi:hypothetical protein